MSRSGYSDSYDEVFPNALGLYRNSVERAIKGARGQHLLRKLLKALDEMPVKELIADAIQDGNGKVCALGALDPTFKGYDADELAKHFGIARSMAAEIVYENDEAFEDERRWKNKDWRNANPEQTPAERWAYMRAWVAKQILPEEQP